MMLPRFRPALALVAASLSARLWSAEPTTTDVVLPGDEMAVEAADASGLVEYSVATGRATARNGGVIRGRGITLTARTLELDQKTMVVSAEGDVTIRFVEGGEARLWRGERGQFNIQTKEIIASDFRLGQAPFFIAGQSLEGTVPERGATNGGRAELTGAILTTDDVAEPAYRVRARRLVLDPGKTLRAEGATFYLGSVPVLHLPHYTRRLDRHEGFWTFQPGVRNRFGPYLETEYHWFARTNVEVIAALDWRQRRGLAGGPGLNYDFGKLGQGGGRFYYAHDELPDLFSNGLPVDPDRHLYSWQHVLTNQTGLTLHGLVNGQNDPLVLRDFHENQFRRDPQPKSFFEANQRWDNWSLDVLAQPQLISFYQTVERLPDAKLTGFRQQVGNTPVYYESDSSLAYLRLRPGLLGGEKFSAFRADTYHQLTLPQTYFGWLNFLPRVGGRFSYYGDPEDSTTLNGDQARGVFNTGAEVNFKASRVWTESKVRWLDVSGLRHIVVPSVNYVYVPTPNVRPNRLPQFDTDLPSPRLLPIEFPDYYAVDSVDSQNTLRLGLFNKLQTKRRDTVADLFLWNVVTDWRLKPRTGQGTFPGLFSDLEFLPRDWLVLGSEVRYDLNQHEWAESNHRLTIQPNDRWHWTVGHRYLRDDFASYGAGNNLFYSSIYWRFNQNWGARTVHYFEARDGRLEDQAYSIYRDFRAWTAALVVRLRDQRTGLDDWSVSLSFSLKAFPRFGLDADRDRVRRLFGGSTDYYGEPTGRNWQQGAVPLNP